VLYLIEPQALQTLREHAHLAPTVAERMAFEREHAARRAAGPAVAGDVATLDIEGVLTPKPDPFAKFFGGGNTSYGSIQAALRSAKADPNIKHMTLRISSPGGTVAGLFETLDEINEFKASGKTMSVTSNFACSAAYALAAVAGPIDATGEHASFGSVGVAASFFLDSRIVDIASTQAPNKRPDLSTAAGKAVVQKELDDIHALFVRRIAEGRGLPTTANFGKGGVVLAREALGLKMVDSIGGGAKRTGASAAHGSIKRQALELRARMGDEEAMADLLIERLQGRSNQHTSQMSRDEKAEYVADVVCGKRRPVLTYDDAPAAADGREPADIVADFVCGHREPSRAQRSNSTEGSAAAGIVAGKGGAP
jgi:ClpP class serine protease